MKKLSQATTTIEISNQDVTVPANARIIVDVQSGIAIVLGSQKPFRIERHQYSFSQCN